MLAKETQKNLIKINDSIMNNSITSGYEIHVGAEFKYRLDEAAKEKKIYDKISIQHLKKELIQISKREQDIYKEQHIKDFKDRDACYEKLVDKSTEQKYISNFVNDINNLMNVEFDHIYIINDKKNFTELHELEFSIGHRKYRIETPSIIIIEVTIKGDVTHYTIKTGQVFKQLFCIIDWFNKFSTLVLYGKEIAIAIEGKYLRLYSILASNGIFNTQYLDFYKSLEYQQFTYFQLFQFSKLMQKRIDYAQWTENRDDVPADYNNFAYEDFLYLENIYSPELVFSTLTALSLNVDESKKQISSELKNLGLGQTNINLSIEEMKNNISEAETKNEERFKEAERKNEERFKEAERKNEERFVETDKKIDNLSKEMKDYFTNFTIEVMKKLEKPKLNK